MDTIVIVIQSSDDNTLSIHRKATERYWKATYKARCITHDNKL